MKNIILISAVLAMFRFGCFLMDKVDQIIEQNQRAVDSDHSGREEKDMDTGSFSVDKKPFL